MNRTVTEVPDDGAVGGRAPAASDDRIPDDRTAGEHRRDRIAVAGGALAGAVLVAVLAIPRLGDEPLWLDEAYSLGVTNQFAYGVKESGGTMLLYYALLWAWAQISEAPAWLRALSTVFAMAAMVPVAAIGRRIGGRGVAVAAPILLAGGYMFQAAALETRAYALEIFVISTCWYLLIRAVEAGVDTPGAKRWWVALTLLAPWGVFIHGLFVLFLAAMVLMVLLGPKPRAGLQRMLPLLGATGVLLALLFWLGISKVGDWVEATEFDYMKFTFYQYLGGWPWVRIVTVAAFVGLAVWVVRERRRLGTPGGAGEGRGEPATARERLAVWTTTVPLVWMIVPPVLLLLISLVRPQFIDRYFVAVTPAVALTVALALVRLARWVAARVRFDARAVGAMATVAVLVVALGWSTAGQENLDNRTTAEWDDLAAMIAENVEPGDGLLLYGDLSRPPFEAAWARVPHDVAPVLANVDRQLGEVKRFDHYYPGVEAAHQRLRDFDRIWAVNVGHGELPAAFYELHGPLPSEYRVAETWKFVEPRAPIVVRLYVRNGT